MLADLETKVLNWIYSASNWRLTVIPVTWEKGRIFVTTNPIRFGIGIAIACAILLIKIIIGLNDISSLVESKRISLIILKSILALRDALHVLLQINTWIYRTEFVRLINQSLDIDTIWGN